MRKLISLLLILASISGWAQEDQSGIYRDTTKIEERQFSEAQLEEYRADSDFDYGTRPTPELSLWERFKRWVAQLFRSLFYFGTETPWGKLLLYVGAISLIVAVVMRILKTKQKGILAGGGASLEYGGALDENIHEMDFPKLITDARNNRQFRKAVRLIFLYALKRLADSKMVEWEAGKTNYDYVSELEADNLRPHFGELSFYFDYAWYGDFKVDESTMRKVDGIFSKFNSEMEGMS